MALERCRTWQREHKTGYVNITRSCELFAFSTDHKRDMRIIDVFQSPIHTASCVNMQPFSVPHDGSCSSRGRSPTVGWPSRSACLVQSTRSVERSEQSPISQQVPLSDLMDNQAFEQSDGSHIQHRTKGKSHHDYRRLQSLSCTITPTF